MAIFIGRFYGRLNLSNTEFRRGVNIVVISEWFKLPEAEAEACRIKRISYEREGKKDDADRIFVQERRALKRAKIWQAKEQLGKLSGIKSKLKAIFELLKVWLISGFEYVIADFTCHYGTNWRRPVFLWLFTVLIFVPFVYSFLNGCLHLNVVKGDSIEVKSLLDYIYFSIVTATTSWIWGLSSCRNRKSNCFIRGNIWYFHVGSVLGGFFKKIHEVIYCKSFRKQQ